MPLGCLALGLLLASGWSVPVDYTSPPGILSANPRPLALLSGFFLENLGQLKNADIRYYLPGGAFSVGFAEAAVVLWVTEQPSSPPRVPRDMLREMLPGPDQVRHGVLIRITFEGANPVTPQGRDELTHRTHFFLGQDPSQWRTDVHSYRQVIYEGLYEGIDLLYRAEDGRLKYDFVVRAGADPALIRMSYEGVEGLRVDSGELVLRTVLGDLREKEPVAFQAEREVACAFQPQGRLQIGFACEGRDDSRALVIDPLVYATFLGGGELDEGHDIAIDPSGSAFVTGRTDSVDFPTAPGGFDTVFNGTSDAFVARLNPSGSDLVYFTFLGGGGQDFGYGIALDPSGSAFVTGFTASSDFPVTTGAYDGTYNGSDAFVAELSPGGDALTYSTFLGGSGTDVGHSIATDGAGNGFVTGATTSQDFSTTSNAYDTDYNGGGDAFVARFNATGSGVVYATFLGGSDWDIGYATAVDSSGGAVVTGYTRSNDFPTTPGAYDPVLDGITDSFVVKLSPAGSGLVFSTLVGGGGDEIGWGIALDSQGNSFVTGRTQSPDFPATPGAYDTTYNGGDAFVAKLNATGRGLLYATFLGGTNWNEGWSIAGDAYGNAIVGGYTNSPDFPATPNAYDTSFGGGSDAFVAKLNPAGSRLTYATFLGGPFGEVGDAIAVDSSGNVFVTGASAGPGFPVTLGAYDTTFTGLCCDAYVAKLSLPPEPPPILPPSNLTATVSGGDIVLNFDPSSDPRLALGNLSYYEVYGGVLPYAIDFGLPIGRTASRWDTTWTDFGPAGTPGESYYTVVAVNSSGERSANSNTVGRLTVPLRVGLNAISLPLEPFASITTAGLAAQMGATNVQWMNAGAWDVSDSPVAMHQGLLATMPAPGLFTYTGLPGSHTLYRWGPGFAPSDAKPTASLDPSSGDLTLSWPPAPGADAYQIYRATEREGFHLGQRTLIGAVPGDMDTFTAPSEVIGPGSLYYMITPVVAGVEAGSSYSIGVEALDFPGTMAFGVSLRLDWWPAVSALADGIQSAQGLLWLTADGIWVPHFRAMPSGVYDTATAWGAGYQIQARGGGQFSFVGY